MGRENTTLCHYCIQLFPIEYNGHSTRQYYPNVATLLEKAEDCIICMFLRQHLSLDETANVHSNESISLRLRLKEPRHSSDGINWAILELETRSTAAFGDIVHTETFSITSCSKSALRSHDSIWNSENSSVQDKISMVKRLLQYCESKHGYHCHPTAGAMPKRLVDVGSVEFSPRLVLVEDMLLRNKRYATLSHCWGGTAPMCLLKSTTQSYTEGINYEHMPRTFRDAISITRALGISYIWIDSLCITQDDIEEWEQEAVKMHDIYSGSTLNIAASDARNSEDGCFAKIETEDQAPTRLFSVNEAKKNLNLVVRIWKGDTRQATKRTVLSTRGWVFQEQLLSHRMVSCMSSELHWNCIECVETESGVQFDEAMPNVFGQPSLYLKSDAEAWRAWVHDYSKRHFTFWKDRLPALSGILNQYQNIKGDVPLIGLWKSSLVQDMLWVRLGPCSIEAAEALQSINLPSWSWLACPAFIDFDIWKLTRRTNNRDPFVTEQGCCTLVDWSIKWDGLPFISKVKEAHLILEGLTINLQINGKLDSSKSNPPYLDVAIIDPGSGLRAISGRCAGQFDHDLGNAMQTIEYTCLLLWRREHTQSKMRREIFLILEKSDTMAQCSVYKRVGIACFISNVSEFTRSTREQIMIE